MKIYTRTGDGGETGLFGGRRVPKDDLRVEAYGTIDELNACIGWAASLCGGLTILEDLRSIQSVLMDAGSDLATPPDAAEAVRSKSASVAPEAPVKLEALIDRLEAELDPLTHFLLPGGCPEAAALHVCRTVCRRAERRVVALGRETHMNPAVLVFLNRLSDALFVMARWVNARRGAEETPWRGTR